MKLCPLLPSRRVGAQCVVGVRGASGPEEVGGWRAAAAERETACHTEEVAGTAAQHEQQCECECECGESWVSGASLCVIVYCICVCTLHVMDLL